MPKINFKKDARGHHGQWNPMCIAKGKDRDTSMGLMKVNWVPVRLMGGHPRAAARQVWLELFGSAFRQHKNKLEGHWPIESARHQIRVVWTAFIFIFCLLMVIWHR